ncbi:hypothetical protein BJX70DRAFT_404609 [Aspergillus crustosus]
MGQRSEFKVVIAGGGITGLTLANALQLYDIDFVLLEAKSEIVSQEDISISILPHGNRILDQLGLYGKVSALGPAVDSIHFRNEAGDVIREVRDVNQSLHERHGYPSFTLDYRRVLQLLYDNIRDKKKILTKKELQKVELVYDGVVVRTSDGSTYQGEILVGADGSHSTVRDEMWQLADKSSPGWSTLDRNTGPVADFGRISGISDHCFGIEPGSQTSVFGKGQSYLVNGGLGGRVYWSYFFKLDHRAHGSDLPAFTKTDEETLLDAKRNDNITPTLKFRQLLDRKVSSTLEPLQEYVYKQWSFQRIITIGDAAHKILPITGHGESASIESAAVLANALRKALVRSRDTKPTLQQIEHAFATVQKIRQPRLNTLKAHAHKQQRTELLDTAWDSIKALYILPQFADDTILSNLSRDIPSADRLDSPKLPPKSLLIPYKDELLSTPQTPGFTKWYFIAAYLAISAFCYHGMWIQPGYYGLWDHLANILKTGEFPYNSGFPLKRTFVGNKFIDNIFTYLSAVFMSGLKDWDPSFRFMNIYFLGILIQPIAVWTVEAHRKRNYLTPLYFVTIWYTLFQFTGIGIYMPLYYAVYTLVTSSESYWWPVSREVPIQYADTMNLAVTIGYTIPTIVLFLPWSDPFTLQNIESFWQISPMLVPFFCSVFAFFHPAQRTKTKTAPEARIRKATDAEIPPELDPLKRLYITTGIIGALFHIACITTVLLSSNLTMASVFWPDYTTQQKTLGEGVKFMFLIDMWALEVATYIWACQAVWDLKRVGRTDVDVVKAAGGILASTVVLGPGATICAVWWWREGRLAGVR